MVLAGIFNEELGQRHNKTVETPEPKLVRFIIHQTDCRITYLQFKNLVVFSRDKRDISL